MDADVKDIFDLAYENALARRAHVDSNYIDALNHGIEVALGKKDAADLSVEAGKLDSVLLALESINSICEAKAYSESLEFFPVRHSISRDTKRKSMVTIRLRAGEAKFKTPDSAKPANSSATTIERNVHETVAQVTARPKKETPGAMGFAEVVNSSYEKIAEHYKRLSKEEYGIEFKVPEVRMFSDDKAEPDNESKFKAGVLGYYKDSENTIHLTRALYEKYLLNDTSIRNEDIYLTLEHELGHAFATQMGYDKTYGLRGEYYGSSRLRYRGIRDIVASEFLANLFGARIDIEIKGASPTNKALADELLNQATLDYLYKDTDAAKIYFDTLLKKSKELMDKHAEIKTEFKKKKRDYTDNGGEIDLGYFKTYLLEATAEAITYLKFIEDGLSALEIYGGPVLGAVKALEEGMSFDRLVSKASKNIKSLKYVKEYFPGAAAVEYSSLYSSFDLFESLGPYMTDVLGLSTDQNKNLNPEKRMRDELEKCEDAIGGMEGYFKRMERVGRDMYENEKKVLGEMERLKKELNGALPGPGGNKVQAANADMQMYNMLDNSAIELHDIARRLESEFNGASAKEKLQDKAFLYSLLDDLGKMVLRDLNGMMRLAAGDAWIDLKPSDFKVGEDIDVPVSLGILGIYKSKSFRVDPFEGIKNLIEPMERYEGNISERTAYDLVRHLYQLVVHEGFHAVQNERLNSEKQVNRVLHGKDTDIFIEGGAHFVERYVKALIEARERDRIRSADDIKHMFLDEFNLSSVAKLLDEKPRSIAGKLHKYSAYDVGMFMFTVRYVANGSFISTLNEIRKMADEDGTGGISNRKLYQMLDRDIENGNVAKLKREIQAYRIK